MLEYYFVGFVDILGFSEMVRMDCHSGDAGPQFFPRIKEALIATRLAYGEERCRVIQFSDSIIVSQKFSSEKKSFREFVEVVANLQLMLLNRGILCRGGIAHGKHTEDDDVIFSQALVEAYRIESTMAQSPRVLISRDLLELFGKDDLPIVTDRDGYSFVSFLKGVDFENLQGNLSAIEAAPILTPSVAAKVRWLADYCRALHPEIASKSNGGMICH